MARVLDRVRLSFGSASGDRALVVEVGAALAVNLGLYAALSVIVPTMLAPIPLRYDPFGAAEVIGSAADLVRLPAIGSFVFVANAVLAFAAHPVDRTIAHLLMWSALTVQALLVGAIWVLLVRATI